MILQFKKDEGLERRMAVKTKAKNAAARDGAQGRLEEKMQEKGGERCDGCAHCGQFGCDAGKTKNVIRAISRTHWHYTG